MSGATAATATVAGTAAAAGSAAAVGGSIGGIAAMGAADAAVAGGSFLASSLPYLSLASAGISALGSLSQSRASAASAGYNAQVAAQNAQIQTQNAQFAGSQGEQEVGAEGAKNKARAAATLAQQGASGVDVNTGSDVSVRESEAKIGMLNALTIRSNAAKQAYGFQTASASQTGESQLLKSQQKSDTTGGYLSAAANVLGGVGNAAKYSSWLSSTSPVGF